MKTRLRLHFVISFLFIALLSCGDDPGFVYPEEVKPDLTIFFVNDQHGQINNFSKVKALVDAAKAEGNALLVSAGDVFSGNPVVDQYSEQGFPMIDIMNQVGFEVAVLGNHEFDFGPDVLEDRISQSQFPWIVANMDASNSAVSQPAPHVTLSVGDLRVTFLGLLETNGKEGDIIPSTHPLKVTDFSFQRHTDVVGNYADLKAQENADVLVALTHLGSGADRELARTTSFFDLIIGGHSHEIINETVNDVPIAQAGANLQLLGKIELSIENQEVTDVTISTIDLNNVTATDAALEATIASYNDNPELAAVVGQSEFNHQSWDVGCFYTEALKEYMNVDFTIQNLGGIRAGIDQGPITRFEIFRMDPFNNGSMAFTKTVAEFETFFCQAGQPFLFSGIQVDDSGNDVQILDGNGVPLADDTQLTLGVNDYIVAIYNDFFDVQEADIRDYTTAEAIIGYLQNINATINYEGCVRVFECN